MCGSWRCHGDGSTVPCVVTARQHPHQAVQPPWLPHTQRGWRAEAGAPALGRQTSASRPRSCTPSSPCKVLPLRLRGDSPGRVGGSWSPHRPAWYQQQLNVLQSKGGSFSRSHGRKSLVRTESCSPACVRRCRRTSVPWVLFRRYRQVPSAVPLPGAGPAEPAPPPLLSRSRQRRDALGCDRPRAGTGM